MLSYQGKKWPTELEDRLKIEWIVNGLSASQIGKLFGMTRNAVIGKIFRLKLPDRPQDKKPRSMITITKKKRDRSKELERERLKRRLAREEREREKQKLVELTVPLNAKLDAENVGLDILDLKNDSCRDVLRYGADGLPRYCGIKTEEGHSFCPRHSAIYYNYTVNRASRPFRLFR